MFDGAIVTKWGPGGNLGKFQCEVYAAVGVRLVKNDTTSGRRDGVDSDASGATSPSPCDADNAGAASLRRGGYTVRRWGIRAIIYSLRYRRGRCPKRTRRGNLPASGSLAELRGRLQEGGSNDNAKFEGRKLCLRSLYLEFPEV